MAIKKFFYDLETTGVDPKKHSIHQIAGLIDINGEVVEEFNIPIRPHPKAKIEPEALKIGNVTLEQVMSYQPHTDAYADILRLLTKYVDRFDQKDKMWQVGYNNRGFDDPFLRKFFELNKDNFLGSWFWSDSLDVMVLASQYLMDWRSTMPSFKLHRVAKELGVPVDDDKLHDALYDVHLTRKIYYLVT